MQLVELVKPFRAVNAGGVVGVGVGGGARGRLLPCCGMGVVGWRWGAWRLLTCCFGCTLGRALMTRMQLVACNVLAGGVRAVNLGNTASGERPACQRSWRAATQLFAAAPIARLGPWTWRRRAEEHAHCGAAGAWLHCGLGQTQL